MQLYALVTQATRDLGHFLVLSRDNAGGTWQTEQRFTAG